MLMQASEGEGETDSMFPRNSGNSRPASRSPFTTAGRGASGGKSRGVVLLVVALIIAGIFGGFCFDFCFVVCFFAACWA